MAKKVAIGIQSFEKLREGNYFYVFYNFLCFFQ